MSKETLFKKPLLLKIIAHSRTKKVELNFNGPWLQLHNKLELPIQVPYDTSFKVGREYIESVLKSINIVPAFNDAGYQATANARDEVLRELEGKLLEHIDQASGEVFHEALTHGDLDIALVLMESPSEV